ncbi:MAG: ATP-binding cassette domain-containing protein [Planctomycetota bacterium]|nr:ATP-binding cassette domain-containing protein [Planctomycetota bacterium]
MSEASVEDRAPGVEARGLTKVFSDPRRGDVKAAWKISFACHPGEIFGLLGPNGAGKTTVLRMLSTVLRPTSGGARVAGFDVVDQPLEVRRRIGFLSSSTGLYGKLTARETLEYFGRLYGMTDQALRSRVDELVELFGIGDFAATRCEKLSTGMKQKVSIARAIVHDPPVLILDEPTLGLDILVASTMLRFIEECRAAGKCVIFSTHIMSEVEKLCDRIAVIHEGLLRAVGSLDELREATGARYLEDVFRRLIGEGGGEGDGEGEGEGDGDAALEDHKERSTT